MEEIDFNQVPSEALNYTTRLLLGQFLNTEQTLQTDGVISDYNGLAQEMGFSYNELRSFQRSDNPTKEILDAWTGRPNATIGELLQYLENLGRHDVLQEVYSRLEIDARLYFQRISRPRKESPLQVNEVTSCGSSDPQIDEYGILTLDDAHSGECTMYDAFVCYADEDIEFVNSLITYLESEAFGFKLYNRRRDLLAGHSEFGTSMQLIQERCKRVLIILSPDFLKCPACEVQSNFAASLGYEERRRKLIPIVYKPCEIPRFMRSTSMIDFTKPGVKDWIWDQLVSSIQNGPCSTFTHSGRYQTIRNAGNTSLEMNRSDPNHLHKAQNHAVDIH